MTEDRPANSADGPVHGSLRQVHLI
jgi:hypothetical protein